MDFEITESSFPGATHLLLGVFRKLFYSWKLVQRFALFSGELSFASFQKTFHLNNITFSDSNALDRIFAGANTSTLIHTNMGIWASVHLINHPLKVAFFSRFIWFIFWDVACLLMIISSACVLCAIHLVPDAFWLVSSFYKFKWLAVNFSKFFKLPQFFQWTFV